MDNNICEDFLNAMKNFVNDALKKRETEEVNEETVTAEAENIQVSPEDSIATTKGNEEKNEMEAPIEEQTAAGDEQVPVLTSADETEGDPDHQRGRKRRQIHHCGQSGAGIGRKRPSGRIAGL